MFNNLIESAPSAQNRKRVSRILFTTFAGYCIGLSLLFVMAVLAYDATIDVQNEMEVPMVLVIKTTDVKPEETPEAVVNNPTGGNRHPANTNDIPIRKNKIESTDNSTKIPDKVSAAPVTVKSVPKSIYKMGDRDYDAPPLSIGTGGRNSNAAGNGSGNDGKVLIKVEAPPEVKKPEPVKPKETPKILISGKVLNSTATSLPKPPYPAAAKTLRVSGTVNVKVTISEYGKVTSAVALTGHPLLRTISVEYAYKAQFTPTTISGQPVKVSGVIVYNFNLTQ